MKMQQLSLQSRDVGSTKGCQDIIITRQGTFIVPSSQELDDINEFRSETF